MPQAFSRSASSSAVGLDEHEIAALLDTGAPIDGFGVGTGMSVSDDAPALDVAYKLSEYAGEGRTTLSRHKPILPGRKQIFRQEQDGKAVADVIARAGEQFRPPSAASGNAWRTMDARCCRRSPIDSAACCRGDGKTTRRA